MLYLEDYLEMIEHLPQELRDRSTEIRELDLSVHNGLDSLEKRQKAVFLQCRRGELQDEAAEAELEAIRREYDKVLEDADEKVTLASQLHELVERYMRRLDSELFKFKCELEADHNGITEILEKRSLEMDGNTSVGSSLANIVKSNQKENRFFGAINSMGSLNLSHGSMINAGANTLLGTSSSSSMKEHRHRLPKVEKRRDSGSSLPIVADKRPNVSNLSTTGAAPSVNVVRTVAAAAAVSPAQTSSMAYNLQQLGGSASTAIAAAASQAIVATQQMQQGRRTASLKASYEAIHGAGGGPTEFWINRDIANVLSGATSSAMQTASAEKKQKKKVTSNISHATVAHTPAVTTVSLMPTSNISLDAMETLNPTALTSNSGAATLATSGLVLGTAGVAPAATLASNRAVSLLPSTSAALVSPSTTLADNGLSVDQTADAEWPYDPNEPRYCICNQVSYGDMVACDNDACPYEWFHYPCVEITQPPKGKWYCPKCTQTMRRRGNRKN